MTLRTIALFAAATTAFSLAHAENEDQIAPAIDVSITGVVSDPQTGVRAIAGYKEEGSYLGVDRIRGGRAIGQDWIDTVTWGPSLVRVSDLHKIRIISLRGSALTFETQPRQGSGGHWAECTARLRLRGPLAVESTSCAWKAPTQSTGPQPLPQPLPVPPSPPPVVSPIADLGALSAACNAQFSYPKDRRKCVDTATRMFERTQWSASTIDTISACGSAFSYPSDRMSCIEVMSRANREPAGLVRYCERQESYPSDRTECLRKFAAAN